MNDVGTNAASTPSTGGSPYAHGSSQCDGTCALSWRCSLPTNAWTVTDVSRIDLVSQAYLRWRSSALKKAAELASDHGPGVPALAEALKLSAAQVRDLLGDVDDRPVLRLVGDRD